ncbi:MAG: CBS domain-containing protein [Desulfopila sp.]
MQIVTSHKQTDFDALASIVAATLLYPGSVGVVPKQTSRNVSRFLSTHKTAFNLILPHEVEYDKISRLIVVDTADWHRLDRMEPLKDRPDLDIHLWDHHQGGDITPSWSCREDIGATVTLLIRQLRERRIALNPLISTVLLIGLYEDTGHLTYPSTTAEDAHAAAFLLENGADLNVASFFLNPPYEEKQRQVLLAMLQGTDRRIINALRIGFNIVPLGSGGTTLADVVSMYHSIIDVDALFVIFTSGDRATVIGRSGVEEVNIGRIMRELGGGGHGGAGSATIPLQTMSAEAIQAAIIRLLEKEGRPEARIADLMSFPVHHVAPDTSMREVRALMARRDIRSVLVMESDAIQGIVVLWDFKKLKSDKHWDRPAKAYMTRELISVAPDSAPMQIARLMLKKDIGHLPVIEHGKVIGIVTRTDILNYFYNLLPK